VSSPTYFNPTSPNRVPSRLIAGMMKYPTKAQHPRENQISEALCWLIDRSDVLAKATIELFLPPARAAEVLAAAGCRVGASTRISLDALPGGKARYYYPDVWLAGAKNSFQLMIEAKVTATEHPVPVRLEYLETTFPKTPVPLPNADGFVNVIQKDAYRLAWSLRPAEVHARFVGLISREGDGVESTTGPVPGIEQTRNVSWRELGNRFAEITDSVEDEARVVLEDFLHALGAHVERLGPPFSLEEASRVVRWGRDVLTLAYRDQDWIPASRPKLGRPGETTDSFGFHIRFLRPGSPTVDVHAFATHPDSDWALVHVAEPAFYLLRHRSADLPFSEWHFGAGRGGYVGWRRYLPFSKLGWRPGEEAPTPADALPEVTRWIRESLEACGLG
jgi:hypothetical protein